MQLPQLTKLYYSIGEVADMFHVAASVIRYWETEFPVLHPAKNSKGERKFTAKDIEILQQIYHLVKEKGFTIDGAKKELESRKAEKKEMGLLLKRLKELKRKAKDMRDNL
jgi:DNA-binding transcriptional MerR regulator